MTKTTRTATLLAPLRGVARYLDMGTVQLGIVAHSGNGCYHTSIELPYPESQASTVQHSYTRGEKEK